MEAMGDSPWKMEASRAATPSRPARTIDAVDCDPNTPSAISDLSSLPNPEQSPLRDQTSNLQADPDHGPRRGSFPDILPSGHTLPQPINAALHSLTPELSQSMEGVLGTPDPSHEGSQTDSDPGFQSSRKPSSMSAPRRSLSVSQETEGLTITVTSSRATQAPRYSSTTPAESETQKIAGDRKKQYVLPDGSVVSGKGLGRGRPGVKRGPRNAQHQVLSHAASISGTSGSPESSQPPSKRRKSGVSPATLTNAHPSTSATTPSREVSAEYTPTATHTRSGRYVQRLASLTATTAASVSPSRKTMRMDTAGSATSASPATVKTHPKIKRRIYRGREQFALCEHCLRGHGPPNNVIVFCDACNKCWHQRCHEPPVSQQTVLDPKAEWFCVDCDRILHGAKKSKKPPAKTSIQPTSTAPVISSQLAYDGPRVGGRLLDVAQKLAYISTLSKDDLISLLLEASDLAPDLPLFKRLVPVLQNTESPQAQFTSTYVTPVSKPPTFAETVPRNTTDNLDEGYDDYFDDHAALYPKPGNGVQLPPEGDDLHILLEGKDSKTFSHWVRGMGGKDFCGSGNIVV